MAAQLAVRHGRCAVGHNKIAAAVAPASDALAVDPMELRRQVELLYAEEATPHGALLQWRLQCIGSVKRTGLEVRAAAKAAPCLRIEETGGTKGGCSQKALAFVARLDPEPADFVDFQDDMNALADSEESLIPGDLQREAAQHFLIGGWQFSQDMMHDKYVLAEWLRSRSSVLSKLSFGRCLRIVRFFTGGSCAQVLGKRDGRLVPYPASEKFEKSENARRLLPTGLRPGEDWVTSWEDLASFLMQLLHQSGGPVRVCEVKNTFRKKFGIELSETALGHTCLTSLMKDERFTSIFDVSIEASSELITLRASNAAPKAVGPLLATPGGMRPAGSRSGASARTASPHTAGKHQVSKAGAAAELTCESTPPRVIRLATILPAPTPSPLSLPDELRRRHNSATPQMDWCKSAEAGLGMSSSTAGAQIFGEGSAACDLTTGLPESGLKAAAALAELCVPPLPQFSAGGQEQQCDKKASGVLKAGSAFASLLEASEVASFKVGDVVEAQCPGWGEDWFPGVVRKLWADQIQVLWDGESPSVSNVDSSCVRSAMGADVAALQQSTGHQRTRGGSRGRAGENHLDPTPKAMPPVFVLPKVLPTWCTVRRTFIEASEGPAAASALRAASSPPSSPCVLDR